MDSTTCNCCCQVGRLTDSSALSAGSPRLAGEGSGKAREIRRDITRQASSSNLDLHRKSHCALLSLPSSRVPAGIPSASPLVAPASERHWAQIQLQSWGGGRAFPSWSQQHTLERHKTLALCSLLSLGCCSALSPPLPPSLPQSPSLTSSLGHQPRLRRRQLKLASQ